VAVFRWVDHTSELELEIKARSEREVYAQAVRAMAELLGEDPDARVCRRGTAGRHPAR
jgi:hypothetical protein